MYSSRRATDRKKRAKTLWCARFFVGFAGVALALFAVSPATAHAGVFSFVHKLFGKNAENAEERSVSSAAGETSQTIPLLRAALHPDPNPAKGGGGITIVGDSALLPDEGPSGTLADIDESVNKHGNISLYVVREGDSLSQIAKMFGVSVNTIVWANDGIGRGGLIREGQTLVILPVSGVRHTVRKGETIASIAKKYKGNIREIMDFNGLSDSSALAVGDTIVIPDGELSYTAPSSPRRGSARKIVRGANAPSYRGYYIRPLRGGVKTQGLHGYNAVDIAAPYGTPIFASASGTVIISRQGGWNGGYGTYIVVKHDNGTQTLYAHNSRNIVYVGQKVVRGQIIGYVGSTGRSTGNHVHFEIRGAKNPF